MARPHAPAVLIVGPLPTVERALGNRTDTLHSAETGAAALDVLAGETVDAVITAATLADLSGAELAAIAHERASVSTVVVGADVPASLEDITGVHAVCAPADTDAIVEAALTARSDRRRAALSEETIDALDALYELDHRDDSLETWLESVCAIGCRRLDLPFGFVTRIEDGTQQVVAAVGDHESLQAGASAPLSEAYCRHTIQSDDIVGFGDVADVDWVDETAIERFGLSCYLGGRIELDDLYGTICFADRRTSDESFGAEEQTFVKLLTKWVRYELARRERQSEIRLKNRVMDEAEIGITISDPDLPDNPLIYANDGFERVTGYPTEETVGRNCRFLQGEDTDPETVAEIRQAIDAEEGITTELRNYRRDGTEFWSRLQIHPITEDGEVTNFVGFQRDVTEAKEREQELEAYETAVNTAADGISRLDSDGRFRMVSDAVCAMTGYDREALLGQPLSVLLSDRDSARTERHVAEAIGGEDRAVSAMTVTVERADGTTFPAENRIAPLTEDGNHRGTVVVTRDISDRKAHERTLTELHDVSRGLLGAEDSHEISRTIADAADEILDIEAAAVFRFDESANRLVPEGVPDATTDLLGDLPTFGPGDGIAWDAFVSGERRLYDDVSDHPDAYNPATPIRSELLLPIGEYGLLACGSTELGVYDERTAELADLLAANAEAAYDRMAREQRLHRRETELRKQNRRLERLDEVNDRIRRICHELVGATTHEEIATLVTEGLAAVDEYAFVWLGSYDHVDGAVRPETTAGATSGYLDTVSMVPEESGGEPGVLAATGGETVVHDRIASDFRSDDWQGAALNRDYRAVAAVPLRHGGVPYGALTVYADSVDTFDEETQRVLEDLADTVAYSMAAVEQRQALLSDQRVELVFGLDTQPTTVFTLASELDATLAIDRLVSRSDGVALLYGSATGTEEADFERYCRDSPGIEDVRLTPTGDDRFQFELHVTGPFLGTTVADHGGSFERLVVDDGRGRLAVTFPASAAVSEFIRLFTERYDGVELLARREQAPEAERAETAPSLTDRQREALAVAYERGFYDWPRRNTGEEIATSLDITAPTFLEHLRRAESKIVDSVLERRPDEGKQPSD
jgi:PAS domain S-box-containing protein